MDIHSPDNIISSDWLTKISVAIWIGILFLLGTYFRIRPQDASPDLDWLVLAQVLACMAGGIFGLLLIKRSSPPGLGGKMLLVYIIAVGVSVIFSPYKKMAFGYWILLLGTALLTMGLVQQARTIKSLWQVEKAWLFTVAIISIKDTITSLFFVDNSSIENMVGGPFRLGMGVTHANDMSLMAAIGFWLTFRKDEMESSFLLWLLRILFLLVIAMARTRSSMISIVMAGLVWFWFKKGFQEKISSNLRIAMPNIIAAFIIFGILLLSFHLPGIDDAFSYFNRNEDSTALLSISGRTEIWHYALERIVDTPYTILFGHGYGVSRFVLNGNAGSSSFYAYHAHNTFLEILLAIGLLGLIPFILLALYNFKWLTAFHQLRHDFSSEFALRAISVFIMLSMSSITEAYLVTKMHPIAMISIFYLLSLDRRYHLAKL